MPTSYADFIHSALYRHYGSDNVYTIMSGTFTLPLAVDQDDLGVLDSPVITVQAHAPYRIRQVIFNEQKQGSPPMIPSPESTGKFLFTEGNIYFDGPTLDSNGFTSTWRVRGSYTFIEDIKSNLSDGFVLGAPPFLSHSILESVALFGNDVTQNSQYKPSTGAIAYAGADPQLGYVEAAKNVDLTNPIGYAYYNTSYFPPLFLNNNILNGGNFLQGTVLPTPAPDGLNANQGINN
jgi:hypothetical protein